MITAIRSLSQVHGAQLWLLFWFICALGYLGIGFLIRENRTGKGRRNVLLGLLAAEIVVDLVWAAIYYPNGVYCNHGLGAVFGLGLWVVVPAAVLGIVTAHNRKAACRR